MLAQGAGCLPIITSLLPASMAACKAAAAHLLLAGGLEGSLLGGEGGLQLQQLRICLGDLRVQRRLLLLPPTTAHVP
jgi:hypothetical protein